MAYIVKLTAEYGWVPDGSGPMMIGQRQANFPAGGVGGATPLTVFAAQSASDYAGELVPGGDSPTGANFQTALNAAAADLYTQLTTAGDVPGFTSGTLLALVQGWSTGNP